MEVPPANTFFICHFARSKNIDDKVDDLAEDLTRLTLLVKLKKENSDTLAGPSSCAHREIPLACALTTAKLVMKHLDARKISQRSLLHSLRPMGSFRDYILDFSDN